MQSVMRDAEFIKSFCRGLATLGNFAVACANVSQFSRAGELFVADANLHWLPGCEKMLLNQVKNILNSFASETCFQVSPYWKKKCFLV